jgi:hypothetical protein
LKINKLQFSRLNRVCSFHNRILAWPIQLRARPPRESIPARGVAQPDLQRHSLPVGGATGKQG